MKRHERALGGRPSRALTERLTEARLRAMESEPGDLNVIDAVQRIITLHNEETGPKGEYVLYDPFTGEVRITAPYPQVGYVSLAAGFGIKHNPLMIETVTDLVQQARRERNDPTSGHIF